MLRQLIKADARQHVTHGDVHAEFDLPVHAITLWPNVHCRLLSCTINASFMWLAIVLAAPLSWPPFIGGLAALWSHAAVDWQGINISGSRVVKRHGAPF